MNSLCSKHVVTIEASGNWNSWQRESEFSREPCHLEFSSECVVSRLGWRFHLATGTLDVPSAVKVHCLVRAIAYCHFTTFMTAFCVKSGNLEHLESNEPCGGVMSLAEASWGSRIAFGPLAIYSNAKKCDDSPVNIVMSDNSRDYVINARRIFSFWFFACGAAIAEICAIRASSSSFRIKSPERKKKSWKIYGQNQVHGVERVLCRLNSLWRVAPED